MSDERTPLLESGSRSERNLDQHTQFCQLVGTRPHSLPPDQKHSPHPYSLYQRAVKQRDSQNRTYMFTATVTNTLLMSQVVLGATLTGLGASDSSHILVTIFGALNTVIAGLVAFLKSRGQPMRARMFRDDLDRVVDEIENSAVMWLGISKRNHGYDAIDTDDQVTVRGEIARLTRLYDKAVKTNTLNDPDMYSAGSPGDPHSAALRDKAAIVAVPLPAPAAATDAATAAASATGPNAQESPDASPASKPPRPTNSETDDPANDPLSKTSHERTGESDNGESGAKKDATADSSGAGGSAASTNAAENMKPTSTQSSSAVTSDPDESPASAARP